MKQAQPLGLKMDQARARFRRCQIWREGDAGAAEGPGEASAAGGDANPDRPGDAVPQIFVSLVIENMWNPDAGQPPDNLIHVIQQSRQILPYLFGNSVSGRWRSL